jgi:hypothetical protein
MMTDFNKLKHHRAIEEISDILSVKTDNKNKSFFNMVIMYFLAVMASSMRAKIKTKDRGLIPLNVFVCALATSGFGKGASVSILDKEFVDIFRAIFTKQTIHEVAEQSLWTAAIEKAVHSGKDENEEKASIDKIYASLGASNFMLAEASSPAIKQLVQKYMLANCGAVNLRIDEIALNLSKSEEALTVFLELFEEGKVLEKRTKNSNDNKTVSITEGEAPSNLLMFGTPSLLLDGALTEKNFYALLETGYARRLLFGYGIKERLSDQLTADQIYNKVTDPNSTAIIKKWQNHFGSLAHSDKHGFIVVLPDDVAIKLLEYRIHTEKLADTFSEYDVLQKAECQHRYSKALKIAGIFAFIDQENNVTIDHLESAIKLVEESAKCFKDILTREPAYQKLAKFLANKKELLTQTELIESLPFYKQASVINRKELISLATSYGYKNNIIIKKEFIDNIEFFSGSALKETSLNKLSISVSEDFADNYRTKFFRFDHIQDIFCSDMSNYCNHRFNNRHRSNNNVIPGFNLIILDVDGTASINYVKTVLSKYNYFIYTTKRHTEELNRFRVVIPIKYILKLDVEDYRQFMNNFLNYLPFTIDDSSNQIAKKWTCNVTQNHHINTEGEMLDPIKFIPKTTKNQLFNEQMISLGSLDALEKFFAEKMSEEGNRNNNFIKYALCLKDTGISFSEVEYKVLEFNKKLPNPLSENELKTTVLVTIAKKMNT